MKKGNVTVPVGHKGVPQFLKGRIKGFILEEGDRWLPWPLSCIPVDCRKTTLTLDSLVAFTKDNIKTTVESTMIIRVKDPFLYLEADPAKIKSAMDDAKDGLLRKSISKNKSEKVIKMGEDLGSEARTETSKLGSSFGVEVLTFTVTKVLVEPEVEKDLEGKKREELQREREKVELQHFADRIKELTKPINQGGPGLSHDEAVRQIRIALGQLKPTEAKQTFGMDDNVAALIAAILSKVAK